MYLQEVDREELAILQDENFNSSSAGWRPPPRQITMPQALDRLLQDHNTTVEEAAEWAASHRRIIAFRDSGKPVMWDLVVKIFDDFDTVYFHDDLRRRVLRKWKQFGPWVEIRKVRYHEVALAATCAPGEPTNTNSRVLIAMRSDCEWGRPDTDLLGCLLHEMLHAFFIIHCGGQAAMEDNHGHGRIFVTAAKSIVVRCGLDLRTRLFG